MKSKSRHLLVTFALGLGLILGLVWLLGSPGTQPQTVHAAAGDIYCVTPGGGTYAACTQVFTNVQAAVNAATGGEEIRVAADTYTGTQNVPSLNTGTFTATQVVVITKSLTIRGGYTTADWSASDPDANPTTLDAQGQGRVVYFIGDISPTVEGLRISGGDATGLGGGPWGSDAGGGVYVLEAIATISNCVVYSNTASTTSEGYGGGLYLLHSDATLSGNTVQGNTACRARWGYGGGLSLNSSDATLSSNMVVSNTASTTNRGWGGGLYIYRSDATLSGNTIVSNTAATADQGYGGGLSLDNSDATLRSNTVQGNTACRAGQGAGGGLDLWYSAATLNGNTIVSNTATLSLISTGQGGGLRVRRSSPFTLTNNLVVDNQANTQGSGLWFEGTSTDPTLGHLLHNTIADNWSSGQGVFMGDYTTLGFTNTIIAGHHSVGISVTTGSTATLEATLWYNNGSGTGGGGTIFTGTVNVYDDPAFVNLSAWDYQLTAGSAAIDRGVDAGVTTDLDNNFRPIGRPDLGAYEWGTHLYLPMVLRNYGP